MLAALAERIDALGPRFRLRFQAIQAVEARLGRKGALTFAEEHADEALKAVEAPEVTRGVFPDTLRACTCTCPADGHSCRAFCSFVIGGRAGPACRGLGLTGPAHSRDRLGFPP